MSPQIPAGIPSPLRNVTAAFGKISPIEKGETVSLSTVNTGTVLAFSV
jgi:hypothetical protein